MCLCISSLYCRSLDRLSQSSSHRRSVSRVSISLTRIVSGLTICRTNPFPNLLGGLVTITHCYSVFINTGGVSIFVRLLASSTCIGLRHATRLLQHPLLPDSEPLRTLVPLIKIAHLLPATASRLLSSLFPSRMKLSSFIPLLASSTLQPLYLPPSR